MEEGRLKKTQFEEGKHYGKAEEIIAPITAGSSMYLFRPTVWCASLLRLNLIETGERLSYPLLFTLNRLLIYFPLHFFTAFPSPWVCWHSSVSWVMRLRQQIFVWWKLHSANADCLKEALSNCLNGDQVT